MLKKRTSSNDKALNFISLFLIRIFEAKITFIIMRIFLILFFLASFISCSNEVTEKNMIKADVTFLADDELEGRQTGTQGEIKAAAYIADRFKKLGLTAKGTDGFYQEFSFAPKTDPHSEVQFTKNKDGTITGRNVVGFINNNATNTIVIGAHFDHLGYGGDGSLYRDSVKAIHNGADDNASGLAVLLALAKRFMQEEKELDFSILFICFSAHETGLFGSKAFIEEYNQNSNDKLKEIEYVFNLDMVGRLDTLQNTYPLYFRIPKSNRESIWKNEDLPISKEKLRIVIKPSETALDDSCFYQLQIPSATFSTGLHQDYHTSNDDAEKINYRGMLKIILFLEEYISYRIK